MVNTTVLVNVTDRDIVVATVSGILDIFFGLQFPRLEVVPSKKSSHSCFDGHKGIMRCDSGSCVSGNLADDADILQGCPGDHVGSMKGLQKD